MSKQKSTRKPKAQFIAMQQCEKEFKDRYQQMLGTMLGNITVQMNQIINKG